jgi:hypothetical protein
LEAVMATVAVQLGLVDDAVALYKECGRYDLLNNLYQVLPGISCMPHQDKDTGGVFVCGTKIFLLECIVRLYAAPRHSLGLVDDAVALYKECGRYDLLNNLYQVPG